MRERHFPRLCRSCDAPMARQEDTCWHCGAAWASKRDETPNRLRVIPGGASADREAITALPIEELKRLRL